MAQVTMDVEEYYKMRSRLEYLESNIKTMFKMNPPSQWDLEYAREHDSTAADALEVDKTNPLVRELVTSLIKEPTPIPAEFAVKDRANSIEDLYFGTVTVNRYSPKPAEEEEEENKEEETEA